MTNIAARLDSIHSQASAAVADDGSRQLYGGKAAVLLHLREQGFPVPAFEISPTDLAGCVARLGLPLAVRSSASVEDGAEASFAGQFASYLGLNSLDEVQSAVDSCQASVDSDSLREYCRRHKVDTGAIRMNVIIQQMVPAELAGVAFSVNPINGEMDVVIEACLGLGDALLSGSASPLPPDDPCLNRYRMQIIQLARQAQSHYGAPQDIEFAAAGGRVYLLQARPITRIQFPDQIGQWTNADFRDGGVSSSVCTPLMWSLYETIWDTSLKTCLKKIHLSGPAFRSGRMFFGRPYWNLSAVKHRVAQIPGYVEREFDDDLSVQSTYEGDGQKTPFSVWRIIRAVPTLFGVSRFIRRQMATAERIVASGYGPIDEACQILAPDQVDSRFEELIEHVYRPLETEYFGTIFALSLAKLDFKMSCPDVPFAEAAAGLPPLSHMGPQRFLDASEPQLSVNAEELAGRYRHHCRYGIDLIHPRWDEDLEFVGDLIDSWQLSAAGSADSSEKSSAAASEPRRVLRVGSRRATSKIVRLRRLIWLREELRDLSNRMYYHIRRWALTIGETRFLADDVFFMTYLQLIADDRSQIEESRRVYNGFRNFSAPNEIGLPARCPSAVSAPADDSPEAHVWTGIGASAGRVVGVARIAHSVGEALQIDDPDAILVCPFTEPGWTPVLARVRGVITETGGLLSHAAVICREFAIPAVLAVPHATRAIRDGQRIELDGRTGRVVSVRS